MGIFLGYTDTMKNVCYYDVESGQVKTAHHVSFDESMSDLSDKLPNARILANNPILLMLSIQLCLFLILMFPCHCSFTYKHLPCLLILWQQIHYPCLFAFVSICIEFTFPIFILHLLVLLYAWLNINFLGCMLSLSIMLLSSVLMTFIVLFFIILLLIIHLLLWRLRLLLNVLQHLMINCHLCICTCMIFIILQHYSH